jgi:RNA polymerase sigma factor (sigma-70 family)
MHHNTKPVSKLTESTEKFWETVYNRNIGKMIGICYRYTANRQLSEDLAHDAFLKAINKSGGFEGRGSFEAWLRKIVVNHVMQQIRDQKRKHAGYWLQESNVAETEDPYLDTNSSGRDEFSEKELLDAINDLPEHHRLVFNLYVFDNFTHIHIGELLGISAGTSKSHLARARKKLKQLLREKAEEKPNRKRTLLLFFFLPKYWSIDHLYKQQLNHLEIPPEKFPPPDPGEALALPVIKSQVISSTISVAAATIGVILATVFILYQRQNNIGTDITIEDKNHAQVQKNEKEHETTDMNKNYPLVVDSNAATIYSNSVIPDKNIKNKSMKTLDSLGVMLLISSGIAFDSTAQVNEKDSLVNTKKQVTTQEVLSTSDEDNRVIEFSSAKEVKKDKPQEGTFSASRIFWSGKDHELYLKGRIRVNVGKDNFIANGSVTFLGPVYFLVVDDSPVTLGATLNLTDQQYSLKMLSSQEATRKFGEKGRLGAVEISVMN